MSQDTDDEVQHGSEETEWTESEESKESSEIVQESEEDEVDKITNTANSSDAAELPEDHLVALDMLKQKNEPLITWFSLALEYYALENYDAYLNIIETAQNEANQKYEGSEMDLMRMLDSLAAYYQRKASKESQMEKRKEYINKASELYTTTDKICMFDRNHLVGRAFFSFLKDDEDLETPGSQFDFILKYSPSCIPAILGKACIQFKKQDYGGALSWFREAIKKNPYCPAEVRVGLGHCFMKLGKPAMGEKAFSRALQIDENCVPALMSTAHYYMSLNNEDKTDEGIQFLSRAFSIDPRNPVVLNHVANHFFFGQEYNKVQELALRALENSENEEIKAESCYQLARCFHAQGCYEQAFRYYYQSAQCASSSFVLPNFGLGQMYLHRKDTEQAIHCFEKVLEVYPEDYETMKILGSLYVQENYPDHQELAKTYLKKVIAQEPDNFEQWMWFAQTQEETDPHESLNSYTHLLQLFRDKAKLPVPPQIHNNIGSIHYRLGNYNEALINFEEALRLSRVELERTQHDYYKTVTHTIMYNLGRVHEQLSDFVKAESLYNQIKNEDPNYTDCHLRLGCMAKDQKRDFEASEFFKDALQTSNEEPDAWILMANLHLSNSEWIPSNAKFERVLKTRGTEDDAYSLVAMGNAWLRELYKPNLDAEKEKRSQDQAFLLFDKVLKNDPANVWATNGIGAVLAHKGFLDEALDIFSLVREAKPDFFDAWLNIGHIYFEQERYSMAIQTYDNCIKKFCKHYNVEILQYLAHACYRSERLKKARIALLKARRAAPADTVALYNLAYVLKHLGIKVLQDEASPFELVLSTVHELSMAQKYFKHLSIHGDKNLLNLEQAYAQFLQCRDLLSQSNYIVEKSRLQYEEESAARKKVEEERAELRRKQEEEQRKAQEYQKAQQEKMLRRKEEIMARTKNVLSVSKGRGQSQKEKKIVPKDMEEDFFVTDTETEDEDGNETDEFKPKETETKTKQKKNRAQLGEKTMKGMKKEDFLIAVDQVKTEGILHDDETQVESKKKRKRVQLGPPRKKGKKKGDSTVSENGDNNEDSKPQDDHSKVTKKKKKSKKKKDVSVTENGIIESSSEETKPKKKKRKKAADYSVTENDTKEPTSKEIKPKKKKSKKKKDVSVTENEIIESSSEETELKPNNTKSSISKKKGNVISSEDEAVVEEPKLKETQIKSTKKIKKNGDSLVADDEMDIEESQPKEEVKKRGRKSKSSPSNSNQKKASDSEDEVQIIESSSSKETKPAKKKSKSTLGPLKTEKKDDVKVTEEEEEVEEENEKPVSKNKRRRIRLEPLRRSTRSK